jgi:Uma2 family endonuclease
MATVTDLEIDDLESEEREARIVEPTESYEIVNDLFVEEPPLGAHEYWIASRLVRGMILFDGPGVLGSVLEETLFILENNPRLRRRPDIAFVSSDRWPVDRPAPHEAAWDVVPDLAIEIISPSDHSDDIMRKLEEYFRVGVRLVWVIYPDFRKVYAYNSPASVRILQDSDELSGDPVLSGFRFPLSGLFEPKTDGHAPTS